MRIGLIRKIALLLFALIIHANRAGAQTPIYSEADLIAISGNLEGSYILANDITLTQEWNPIGKDSPFKGVLDGNDCVIRNLRINDPQANYIGLFSKTENATIKNLGIEDAEVVAGTTESNGSFVGVMVGLATNTAIIRCYIADSRVEGRNWIGSFAGRINGSNRSLIIDSYSTAQVIGNAGNAGGIFGSAQNTNIINVYYSGEAEAKSGNTSGIVGMSLGGDTIANCLVLSPSLKGASVGRIVGNEEGLLTLRNNYARSDLLIKNSSGAGAVLPVQESFLRGKQGENVPMELPPYTSPFPHYTEADIDKAYDAFNKYYLKYDLSSSRNIYVAKNKNSSVSAIWTQAIFFDVAMNAYKRTGSEAHKNLIDHLYKGNYNEYAHFDWTVDRYPNGWFIFDDIMWWVISLARLYEITGDDLHLEMSASGFDRVWVGANGKRGSYDPVNGGMYWNWVDGDNGKMACINYPTVIAAMTLYNNTGEEEYLRKAKEIYAWAKKNLFDTARGRVADSNHGSGPYWKMHTYNQATCIGAAVMLYQETGDREYLEEAVITANYLKNQMSTNGILPFETGIEQGIYNAIFSQYIIRLIEDGEQYQYIPWLHYNIDNGWGLRDKDSDITDMDHSRQAPAANEIESYGASGIPALMQVISPEIDPDREIHCKSKTFFEKNLGWDMKNVWNLFGDDLHPGLRKSGGMALDEISEGAPGEKLFNAYSDKGRIRIDSPHDLEVEIFNPTGTLVKKKRINGIDSGVALPSGIYVIRGRAEDCTSSQMIVN